VKIVRAVELSAVEVGTKMVLVLKLVEYWKMSSARGGARAALSLAKAHYPELDLDIITSEFPKQNKDGMPVTTTCVPWEPVWPYTMSDISCRICLLVQALPP
jgi:hypothetical protein